MNSAIRRWALIILLLSSFFAVADPVARKIVKSKPVSYPEVARQLHISGTVKLDVSIAANGKVRKIDVVGGHPLLAKAAVEAVRDWEYEPAPAETSQTVIVKFEP